MGEDYTLQVAPDASGPCRGCGMTIAGSGFRLNHASGRSSSFYCSRACTLQDAEDDVLGEGFDDEEISPVDEPR